MKRLAIVESVAAASLRSITLLNCLPGNMVLAKDSHSLRISSRLERINFDNRTEMEMSQTAAQQTVKSRGRGPRSAQDTSAETHSVSRLSQGFDEVQSLSKFRAIRPTVIRLWMNSSPKLDGSRFTS